MKRLTDEHHCIGTIWTNFDHEIDYGVAKLLKTTAKTYAQQPAWNYYGNVWWEDDEFHMEVWEYRQHTVTLSAATIDELYHKAINHGGSR